MVGPIAGSDGFLYLASQTAGVWRYSPGGVWSQIPGAPPHAGDIDVDQEDPMHLVVSERADDKGSPRTVAGEAGVWEAGDGDGDGARP